MKSQLTTSGRQKLSTTQETNTTLPATSKNASSLKRSQILSRRAFVTSVSQAFIAASLALSMLTFVISLVGMLPIRHSDYARQESLHNSTFICIVMPLVLAYCSQSKVIAALTAQWILARRCLQQSCLVASQTSLKLVEAFREAAAFAGLACALGPISFQESIMDYDSPLGFCSRSSNQSVGKGNNTTTAITSSDRGMASYERVGGGVASVTLCADGSVQRGKNG